MDTREKEEGDEPFTSITLVSPSNSFFDSDRLEQCGRWLQNVPRNEVNCLRQTREYEEFIHAFNRLGDAHRNVIAMNKSFMEMDSARSSMVSFFQDSLMDDIVLRVFEYLECYSLISISRSCSRFRNLAKQSATRRTLEISTTRQLYNLMQLLRAQEEIDGVGCNRIEDRPVRTPMLGLPRRVLVTGAGDADYNGIYHCTGSNGNGFVFTKSRSCMSRVSPSVSPIMEEMNHPHVQSRRIRVVSIVDSALTVPGNQDRIVNWDDEKDRRCGERLRCIITKRFSNETILWYMSKEIETSISDSSNRYSQVSQVYSFWAKLMGSGEASTDMCQYPSQTSVLARNGDPAWQSLLSTRTSEPPVVELLDVS